MKSTTFRFIVTTFILSLIVGPATGMAKKGPPPKDDAGAAGELYGDLYVIERDGIGVPITRTVTYEDPETHQEETVACLQPQSSNCALLPLWAECSLGTLWELPPGVLPLPTIGSNIACTFDPELNDPCEVYSGVAPFDYALDLQEVSFGRGSVSRSQPFVIDSAYGEFLKVINGAINLRFDAARRFEMFIPTEDDPTVFRWKTVDAPLENLGLYLTSMTSGCLATLVDEVVGEEGASMLRTHALDPSAIQLLRDNGLEHLVCHYPDEPGEWQPEQQENLCQVTDDPVEQPADAPCWWEEPEVPDREDTNYSLGDGVESLDMLSATAFLAAATDKADPMSLDEMINLNTYLGINPTTFVHNKKVRTLTVEYFPFHDPDGHEFGYTRHEVFNGNVEADLLVFLGARGYEERSIQMFPAEQPGSGYDFVDLDEVNLTVCHQGFPIGAVCDDAGGNTDCGGANWFAQATEHARKTIWYLHNWSVPEREN